MTKNSIAYLLKNESKSLQNLVAKLDELNELNTIFLHTLAPSLRPHYQVAKYENQRIIVLAESGSWTTQLQFKINELFTRLRTHPSLQYIVAIICKTRPNSSATTRQKKSRNTVARLS